MTTIPRTETLEQTRERLDDVVQFAEGLRRQSVDVGPRTQALLDEIADALDQLSLAPRVVLKRN